MEAHEPESTAACEGREMAATEKRCTCRDCEALDEWDGGAVAADLAAIAARSDSVPGREALPTA